MSGLPPPFPAPARRQRPLALRLLVLCFLGGIAVIPVAAGALFYLALSGTFGEVSLGTFSGLSGLSGLSGPRFPDAGVAKEADAPQSPAASAPPVAPPAPAVPEWSSR